MSLEVAINENTAAVKLLIAAIISALDASRVIAPNAEVVKNGTSANTRLPEVEAATKAPTKSTKKAEQPATSETAQSPSASTPTEESPASESASSPAVTALVVNVGHITALVLCLIKKGADFKTKAAGALAKFGAKNVPMVKVADYDAIFAELKSLLTAEEAAAALAAVTAKAA